MMGSVLITTSILYKLTTSFHQPSIVDINLRIPGYSFFSNLVSAMVILRKPNNGNSISRLTYIFPAITFCLNCVFCLSVKVFHPSPNKILATLSGKTPFLSPNIPNSFIASRKLFGISCDTSFNISLSLFSSRAMYSLFR